MEVLNCGCNAMASHGKAHDGLTANHPTCIVHACCEVVPAPNLKGRIARCTYYGRKVYKSECSECTSTCLHETPSNINLVFFRHQPSEKKDVWYCGCYGWD